MIKALSRSKFRSGFKLDEKDMEYIDRVGLNMIKLHAEDFIARRIAPAQPKNDGKQTPRRGHPVFKAQHATATCCRSCLEKWYHIPKGRALSSDEANRAVSVILEWIGKGVDSQADTKKI